MSGTDFLGNGYRVETLTGSNLEPGDEVSIRCPNGETLWGSIRSIRDCLYFESSLYIGEVLFADGQWEVRYLIPKDSLEPRLQVIEV